MTRKDYEAIAAALNMPPIPHYADNSPHAVMLAVAHRIADVMAADNPRFDCARFLKACGVQS